jgi:rhodanese-related sulfurtransferase
VTSESTRPDGVIIQEIEPQELKERLDRGDPLVLVDVRESFERDLADLPDFGQLAIPVKSIPFAAHHFEPTDEIVVYCRSGPRSSWATERLMGMGFSRVLNLKGGVLGWRSQVDPHMKVY